MLSYQHIYHAGCLSDVHKHALLSVLLTLLTTKERPLSYLETHAGRGIYDLNAPEALKTGEAAQGIQTLLRQHKLPQDHPYTQVVKRIQEKYGPTYYPGSPLIAQELLRPQDSIHLMELHPQELRALKRNLWGANIHIHHRDGYEGVLALAPPTPRRGVVFIDPSYEVKTEYQDVPKFLQNLHHKWPEAILVVWYPQLQARYHEEMVHQILALDIPESHLESIEFADLHGEASLYGSGMLFLNTPFGFKEGCTGIKRMIL
jgi:23S rRNA (adenine2030-N6)-methyltransferase